MFQSGTFSFAQRKQVGDDAHRLVRRVNIGAARDVLLQHVVLHRARELASIDSLPPRNSNVKRQQNRSGRVDGHRRGNLRQIDAVEEALHVFDRVDGYTDFADFTHGQRVVGVEADLRRQVKRYR